MDRFNAVSPAGLALFASIYALQGAVMAYFLSFNRLYMTAAGVSDQVSSDVQSLALVPFIFKFLAGPLSDRVSLFGLGRRRPYIVIGLTIQSLGLIGLTGVNPGSRLGAFAAMAVVAVAGLALYDTCCDGMVLDVTPPADRDRVQGILVASRAGAAMLCSLGFGLLLGQTGNGPGRGDLALWICGGLGLVPLALALWVPEPVPVEAAGSFQWKALGVLLEPRSLALLAFGAIYAVVGYGVEVNLSSFYDRRLGFGEGAIGALGSARYVGRMLGASALPLLASRLGRLWTLRLAVLFLAATTAGQAAVGTLGAAGLAALAFGAANGWADAVFFVLAMKASDPRLAASTYALFMAVTNVSVLGGSIFTRLEGGLASARVDGFSLAFLALAAVALLAWPLLGTIYRVSVPEEPPA